MVRFKHSLTGKHGVLTGHFGENSYKTVLNAAMWFGWLGVASYVVSKAVVLA